MCNDVVGAVHLRDILVSSEDLLVVSKLRLGHGRLSALWHDLRRVASPLLGALYSFSGKHFFGSDVFCFISDKIFNRKSLRITVHGVLGFWGFGVLGFWV